MADPFPISSAIDALVESGDGFEDWIEWLPESEVRRCLIEAIAQLQWFKRSLDND